MPNSTLLIDARAATTLPELYTRLADAWGWGDRPAPTNLDGFADAIREVQLSSVVLSGCRLSISDYTRLANVCRDLGVRLSTV